MGYTINRKVENKVEYWVIEIEKEEGKNMIHKGWGMDQINTKEAITSFAARKKAKIAINASAFNSAGKPQGLQIGKGKFLQTSVRTLRFHEYLGITKDGWLKIIKAPFDPDQLIKSGIWQTFSFGPVLMENGKIVDPKRWENPTDLARDNPRTGIGQKANGNYIILIVDGREDISEGVTFQEYAELFKKYNCAIAFNLDGGGSTQLVVEGKLTNHPSDGKERPNPDFIWYDGIPESEADPIIEPEPEPEKVPGSLYKLTTGDPVIETAEYEKVDWLKDRIQPFFLLKMPDKQERNTTITHPTLSDFSGKIGEI